jgi:hypothetical protein
VGTAAVLAFAFGWWRGERPGLGHAVARMAAAAAGMVIPPAATVSYFAWKGAFWIMYYCVILHNIVPGLKRWGAFSLHQWYYPLSLPLMACFGWLIFRQTPEARLAIRRTIILLTPWIYGSLLLSYWPDITREDDLPYVPLTPLTAIALLTLAGALVRSEKWRSYFWTYGLPALAACNLAFTWSHANLREDRMRVTTHNIADVLTLTRPLDYVMDDKGDYVFRRRAYYWVLEPLTKARVRLGLIRDNVPDAMIGTGTKLCSLVCGRAGSVLQQFILANYLPFDMQTRDMAVLGKGIGAADVGGTFHFEVVIPQTYAVVTENGRLAGMLDGKPYTQPVWLATGKHQFVRTSGGGRISIFLAEAYAKGYMPHYDIAAQVEKEFGTRPKPKKNGQELE